ncbi:MULTISPECIES: hypothetical protein [Nostocales]|uniref:Uncharacterized protein n=3 Tax=Nostocales TaxID=1161 RepID=A0A0C1QX88_9CYAN|nr:hypothetical protein [Tolypothrix bouteillei]KAF3885715.1 hypothetical protein DA73_0400009755 [Tolypothrix bouteillei VB521301]
MKQINLEQMETISLSELLKFAQAESVVLVSSDGETFILKRLSEEDKDDVEFAIEVEALRKSKSFQEFLDERLNYKTTKSIEEILADVEADIAANTPSE